MGIISRCRATRSRPSLSVSPQPAEGNLTSSVCREVVEVSLLKVLACCYQLLAIALWTTALWYPLLMEALFHLGIGRRRRGILRRIRLREWLNATGIGIFFGTILHA